MAQPAPIFANQTRLFPLTRGFLGRVRHELAQGVWLIGAIIEQTGTVFRYVIRGKVDRRAVLAHASFVGTDTLGIALVMTTMTGMVIALQVAKEMAKQGAGNMVGALVSLALLRELAPIMTAFSVIALAGSAFAAEISTMKINSQIDALRVLHVNPTRYLVLPRVLATVLMLPLITIITTFAGILGGMLVSGWIGDVSPTLYFHSVWTQTEVKDILAALLKAAVFGYLLSIVATTLALQVEGGAREVGSTTTRTVVWSFVAMAVFDYILTYLIYGTG